MRSVLLLWINTVIILFYRKKKCMCAYICVHMSEKQFRKKIQKFLSCLLGHQECTGERGHSVIKSSCSCWVVRVQLIGRDGNEENLMQSGPDGSNFTARKQGINCTSP